MPRAHPDGVLTIGVLGFEVVTDPLNVAPQTVIVSFDLMGPASASRAPNWMVGQLDVLREVVDHR